MFLKKERRERERERERERKSVWNQWQQLAETQRAQATLIIANAYHGNANWLPGALTLAPGIGFHQRMALALPSCGFPGHWRAHRIILIAVASISRLILLPLRLLMINCKIRFWLFLNRTYSGFFILIIIFSFLSICFCCCCFCRQFVSKRQRNRRLASFLIAIGWAGDVTGPGSAPSPSLSLHLPPLDADEMRCNRLLLIPSGLWRLEKPSSSSFSSSSSSASSSSASSSKLDYLALITC